MSEPSLSDREQAILARLAAQAEAEDPRLARMMRQGQRVLRAELPALPPALRHWGFGVALALVGLVCVLVLLALSPLAAAVASLLIFAGVARVLVSGPWHRGEAVPAPRDRPAPSA